MLAATPRPFFSVRMPRPCAVEFHVRQLDSDERETPRDEPVASSFTASHHQYSDYRYTSTGQARGIFGLTCAVITQSTRVI